MRVTVTGATGLIGPSVVRALLERGDEVTVLSRNPEKARSALPGIEAVAWADPTAEAAPAAAFEGRDAVIHLAGEPVAQRWSDSARERISASRELGTRNLVAGIAAASARPAVLASASGVGYYGPRGDERVPESDPPGEDFLARVCVAWEREAAAAAEHGLRTVQIRTGVVLDEAGGALAKMLLPFKLGVGGPVAGGRQYMPWIHLDDIAGMYLHAIDDPAWSGPVNAAAPEPVTNREFSRALGRALHRPAVLPVPALAIRILYGDMALIVTTGQRAVPERATGYEYRFRDLDDALRDALGKG